MFTRQIAIPVVFLLIAGTGLADDSKPAKEDAKALPKGSSPRMVFVVRVNADASQVIYRDFFDEAPNPGIAGPTEFSEMIATRPIGERRAAVMVAFPLALGEILDAKGKRLTIDAAKARLVPGTVALVSRDGERVDAAFLRAVREDTLLMIFPKPTQR